MRNKDNEEQAEEVAREGAEREIAEREGAERRASPLAAWAGALLVLAALFAVAAIVAFGSLGRNSPWAWAFAVLGVLALAGWWLGRNGRPAVRPDEYSKQRAMLGVNAVLSVLLLLILLVGVNYVAARRHKTFDLTQNKINSLADQTHKALDKLPGKVAMTYVYMNSPFGGASEPSATVTSLLDNYKNVSDKVQVAYVDAGLEPAALRDLKLTAFSGAPVLLIELQNEKKEEAAARQEVQTVDEQNITSALLKLENPQQKTLYFLSGHGEITPDSSGQPAGMSEAKSALESQNYTLQTLSLLKKDAAVPDDAAALIIAGPETDIAASEAKLLREYMEGKGRLVLLLSPQPRQPQPQLASLLKQLGLQAQDGFVFDFEQMYNSPQFVTGPKGTASHPLLRGVSGDVVFPGVRPLREEKSGEQPNPDLTVLYQSSQQSVRAASTQQLQQLLGSGGVAAEQSGPFVLAAAYQAGAAPPAMPGQPAPPPPADGARAVIISSAPMLYDGNFSALGNRSFVQAAINWTAGEEELVSIPPKPPVENKLEMPDRTRLFAMLFGALVMPALALIVGTAIWWKRR